MDTVQRKRLAAFATRIATLNTNGLLSLCKKINSLRENNQQSYLSHAGNISDLFDNHLDNWQTPENQIDFKYFLASDNEDITLNLFYIASFDALHVIRNAA